MKDRVRLYINNKPAHLFESVVKREGTRAVDNAWFKVSRQTAVTKGDLFQYVQDVVDTKYLTGLWNMEYNTRDESGHDLDGLETTSDIHNGEFPEGAGGYYFRPQLSGTRTPIKILDPKAADATKTTIDFSGQFDICILMRTSITGSPYDGNDEFFFSKGDSNNYIKIGHTVGNSSSDPFYLKCIFRVGGATPVTITGSTNMRHLAGEVMSGWNWVRIKRDGDTVSFMLNNTVLGTATVAGNFGTDDPIYIGGDIDGTNGSYTNIAQLRLYCGDILSDEDWDTLQSAKRGVQIMKFGGTVWKIDEKITHKICHCKGLSDILHNLESTSGNGTSNTAWTTGDADIFENFYFDKTGSEIIHDQLKVLNSGVGGSSNLGFNIAEPNTNLTTAYTDYWAGGALYTNLFLLCLVGGNNDASFHVTPRGTILLEDDDQDHQDILFRQGQRCRIKDLGYDDTNMVNKLHLLSGGNPVAHTLENTGSNWSIANGNTYSYETNNGYPQTVNKLHGRPLAITVTDPDGTVLTRVIESSSAASNNANAYTESNSFVPIRISTVATGTDEFKVNWNDKSIYLGNSSSSNSTNGEPFYISGNSAARYVIKYTFMPRTATYEWTSEHSTYRTVGSYAKTLHLPQLLGKYSLAGVAGRIFAKLGDLERRVTIEVPMLVNHIRENYKIKVLGLTYGVGSEDTSGTLSGTPISLSVKSMEFHYPSGKTTINCGEHMFDSFDMDKAFGEAIAVSKSRPVRAEF